MILELKSKFVSKSVPGFLFFLKEKFRSFWKIVAFISTEFFCWYWLIFTAIFRVNNFFSLQEDSNIFYKDRYMDLYKDYKDTTVLFLMLFYFIVIIFYC